MASIKSLFIPFQRINRQWFLSIDWVDIKRFSFEIFFELENGYRMYVNGLTRLKYGCTSINWIWRWHNSESPNESSKNADYTDSISYVPYDRPLIWTIWYVPWCQYYIDQIMCQYHGPVSISYDLILCSISYGMPWHFIQSISYGKYNITLLIWII